ncbi:MAG: hypothetical protein AAFQ37_01665 [Bacteroidota bacterium]
MLDDVMEEETHDTVMCKRSYWLYTDNGGIMTVHPNVTDLVVAGEVIAPLRH